MNLNELNNKIPVQWQVVKIKEVANIISGGTPKSSLSDNFANPGEGIPWVTPADLSGYNNKYISHGKRDLTDSGYESCSAKLMPKNSILFSSRAPIGYVAIAKNDICTNQGFKSFVFNKEVYPLYAYYYLKHIKKTAEQMSSGTTFKELSGAKAKNLPFIFTNIEEQKQIATKLDELLAQVDKVKTRLEDIPLLLNQFRQSVLSTAVNGKLFEKKSSINESKEAWKSIKLSEVAKSISDGDHQAPPKSSEGIPFLVISDISGGQISFDNVKRYVPDTYFNSLKEIRVPKKNDILYSVTGSFGIPVIVNDNTKFCFQRHIAIIKADNSIINSKFLYYVLCSPEIYSQAKKSATGTAQKTVSLRALRNFSFALPPLEAQLRIVNHIENLFKYADKIQKKSIKVLQRVDSLSQSILNSAFSGSLTEKWRETNLTTSET